MQLSTALVAVVAAVTVNAQSTECAGAAKSMAAYDRPFVYPLFRACVDAIGNTTAAARENPYIYKTCVAAAVSADVC